MKILMMVMHFPPAPCGGAEMQCWRQAKALAARGHKVTILTQWLAGRSPRWEAKEGVVIRRLGILLPAVVAVRRLHRWLRMKWTVPSADRPDPFSVDGARIAAKTSPRKFRWMAPVEWMGSLSFILEALAWCLWCRRRPDIVHVHETRWLAGLGKWIGDRLGVPAFCKEACGEVLQWQGGGDVPWRTEWKRRRMRCRFIAITSHIRHELEKAGIPANRICEVPNGVELPELIARPDENDSAIYAGNFSQGAVFKAFDVLLAAWGRVHREAPAIKLRLFGDGDLTRWKLLAERECCGDSVEFVGRSGNLQPEYLQAGYLVLPSRVEGLSNVLLESQAAGLPAIVSDIPGNLAVVCDGVNGLVVPAGDAEALAQAMLRLHCSPALRAEMGRLARDRMAATFDIGRVAEQLEQVYQKAIAEDVVRGA